MECYLVLAEELSLSADRTRWLACVFRHPRFTPVTVVTVATRDRSNRGAGPKPGEVLGSHPHQRTPGKRPAVPAKPLVGERWWDWVVAEQPPVQPLDSNLDPNHTTPRNKDQNVAQRANLGATTGCTTNRTNEKAGAK